MKKLVCKRYIYLIKNKINGKNYIGQRTFEDNPSLDKYFGSGQLLKMAIKKYGKENFEKIILETGFWDKNTLDEKEKYWIAYFSENSNADYNISPGGTGGDILQNAPESRKLAIEKHKKSMAAKPQEELDAMYKHHSQVLKETWKNYSEEKLQKLSEIRSKIQKEKYATDPTYLKMRAEINRQNGLKQSQTQHDPIWISEIGKNSHRRQNIHVAKTFYLDTRTNNLYTLSGIAEVLDIKKTLNVRNQLRKYYPFVIFIDNTKENDLLYNFMDSVIVGGYSGDKYEREKND